MHRLKSDRLAERLAGAFQRPSGTFPAWEDSGEEAGRCRNRRRAFACSKGSGVKVTQLPAGAACPACGVEIDVPGQPPGTLCSGTNGANGSNGTDGTNGANGAQTLVRPGSAGGGRRALPLRQRRARPGPRQRVGGGIAGDGALQAREISQTSAALVHGLRARFSPLRARRAARVARLLHLPRQRAAALRSVRSPPAGGRLAVGNQPAQA
jgi:hypothetical protein